MLIKMVAAVLEKVKIIFCRRAAGPPRQAAR